MKKLKFISIILILNIFQLIISEETNKTNINEEEQEKQERLKFEKHVTEYRKNFSQIKTTILTDENYIDFMQGHPYTLVYFHSFYDQNSFEFMPIFKFINDYLNSSEPYNDTLYLINVGAIEFSNENNTQIQSRYRLTNFPFFIIFSAVFQRHLQYSGYMNAQSIITFCMKAILDNIIQIRSEKRLNQLLNPQVTFLSVFVMRDTFNFDSFYKASQEFQFGLFADCIGKKICKNYFNKPDYQNTDIILAKMNMCKNDFICGDNKIVDSSIKPFFILYNFTTYDDFIEFISLNIVPTIHNMTDFNYELMLKNNFKSIIYIRGQNEKKTTQKISTILQKILKKRKNGIKWGSILDPIYSSNDYEIARLLSIEVEDYKKNGLVLIHTTNKLSQDKETYRIDMKDITELTDEIIIKFVDEFNSGKIKRDIKSELKPKTHPKKNLRMVVGKTFEKDILKNFDKTIILILLTLDMNNLHIIEDQIESICIKFGRYNQTIIFNFMDALLNEMPDFPKYDIHKRPFYRYYYKNKTRGYIDFKGNFSEQSEVEDWIIDNYAKEYGIDEKFGMRMHVDGMSELLKDKNVMKEIEKQQRIEALKDDLGIKDTDDINNENNNNKETDL